MNVVVSKSPSVVVRPSEPKKTSATTMKLSSFDVGLVRRTATALLVFEHPLHDAAETIQRALSQTLVDYYPISGRIVAAGDGDNDVHIECTGEGVAFVAASANCALKEATTFFNRPPGAWTTTTTTALLDELALDYPGEGCGGPTDPLLLVQVTQFSCGGFTVGVTWNHGIADGTGMAQFLQAVGELARGLPSPSVAPVRWDDSLPSLPPSVAALEQLAMSLEPLDLARLGIAVPYGLIRRIKAESGELCTTFEAVAAVLWRCRTRAIISDPDSLALLSFPANVRKHVGAKNGYYGNCITQQLVMATSGAVASAEIVELVEMIKCAKEETAGQLVNRSSGDYDHLLQAIDLEQIGHLQYGALNVSSWRNLGFNKADFGAGTPAKVMCYGKPLQTMPLCVVGLPCKGSDGQDNVFSVCVKQEHVDAFLKELASLA
ncbi:hypothetical protein BS78_07G141000 [Paspalum vaginatum]|nr:hypothetical protein BS78_07G141000 [Paspalum vaginatum]